jgi:hypothetical protein
MNAFLELAERQISTPRKARERAAGKRAKTRAERALTKRDQEFRRWQRWHYERCDALLAGPYSEAARGLIGLLEELTLDSAPQLIEHVRSGPWACADSDTRFLVLALVDGAITALRERNGMPSFDDPLPGAPLNAFLILRELLA